MKRTILITLVALATLLCDTLFAQEWDVPVEMEGTWGLRDIIPVDNRENALGYGFHGVNDGLLMKIGKDGSYSYRVTHLPGMMFCYHAAVQLNDGNYMTFGICDDSLCDPQIQRYLRVDVFDTLLQPVSSRTYSVNDGEFDCFYYYIDGPMMNAILSRKGTVILAAAPSRYIDLYNGYYEPAMRFYEFDSHGDTIRTVDNPKLMATVNYIKEITYEPHSDNLMIIVQGGSYGYNSGGPGVFVADTGLNIIAHQWMCHIGGAEYNSDNACEGRWIDGDRLIVDCEHYTGTSFTYHNLYVVDSALNTYAELRLPPHDSCTWVPKCTNTAYVNDSTVFAVSYCSRTMSTDDEQVNVILTDKHLNLLGRKVIRSDTARLFVKQPVAFSDGGCLVPVSSRGKGSYQGEPFLKTNLMKFRREDIEITWDVVEESPSKPSGVAYPNPTNGFINIPTDEAFAHDARVQIFDSKGTKCLDSEVGRQGSLLTIDIHSLDTGLYVYRVVSGNRELANGKFIKE